MRVPAAHILIPIHDFSVGGTEAIAFRLAEAWMARGRHVTILAGAPDGAMRARVPEGARVELLNPPVPRSVFSRLRLGKPMAQAARALAPDAIFIPGNFHFVLGHALKAALPAVPIVAKISNPLTPGSRLALLRHGERQALGWWSRGIDAFIAMTPALVPGAEAMLGSRKLVAIPDPFLADDRTITPRAGRPGAEGPLRLLTIGRLEPQKNFALALETLALLRRDRDVRLTLLGDGAERARLERRAEALGLAGAVGFAGYQTDVAPFLAQHDLLLMSSRFEGVPAVIGEALCAGLPFAATPCTPWLADLARDSALGALAADQSAAALAKAVRQVAGRPFPALDQIAAAIEPHRMARAADAYLQLFDSLE